MKDIFDRLDQIMEAAYFVPLGVGDALAVQFKAPQLKSLDPEIIAGVFHLIDNMEFSPPDENRAPSSGPVTDFFRLLQKQFPEVYDLWTKGDETLVLDPVGAFQYALDMGEKAIRAWQSTRETEVAPAIMEEASQSGLSTVLDFLDPEKYPDDRSFRKALSSELLLSFPDAIRPRLYLDAWAEYVKAVMDLEPRAEVKFRWPY